MTDSTDVYGDMVVPVLVTVREMYRLQSLYCKDIKE